MDIRGRAVAASAHIVGFALVIAGVSGCSSSSGSGSDAGSTTVAAGPPGIAAYLDQPKAVTGSNGATAEITLDNVNWQAEDAFVSFTITGTSATPFAYAEDHVTWAFPDTPQAWTHDNNDNMGGDDPSADYTSVLPPDPLRVGTVVAGQSKSGQVALRDAKPGILLYFSDASFNDVAEWQLPN